jgi:hypothetical protein
MYSSLKRDQAGSIPAACTSFPGRYHQWRSSRLLSETRWVRTPRGPPILNGPIVVRGAITCPVGPMEQDTTLRTLKFGFESRAGYQVRGVERKQAEPPPCHGGESEFKSRRSRQSLSLSSGGKKARELDSPEGRQVDRRNLTPCTTTNNARGRSFVSGWIAEMD